MRSCQKVVVIAEHFKYERTDLEKNVRREAKESKKKKNKENARLAVKKSRDKHNFHSGE